MSTRIATTHLPCSLRGQEQQRAQQSGADESLAALSEAHPLVVVAVVGAVGAAVAVVGGAVVAVQG